MKKNTAETIGQIKEEVGKAIAEKSSEFNEKCNDYLSQLEKIKDARSQLMLYSNTNFAFMKRNGFVKDFYGVEDYRQLLPIPQRELDLCPQMTQNPGYC